ncbi:MAG: hypothetical protein K5982_04340 [Selenomonadaceae bacterium]|nr:hypothetical protein [Selenomonadaceae bacterium]
MLVELLQICKQKHEEQKLLRTDKNAQAAILDVCIAYAAQMIAFISKFQEENHPAVASLQRYMNDMMQMQATGLVQTHTLKQHITKLQAQVQKNIPIDRIEVVFFPYKASMADSMMTIYLAAKADPSCDAYWCPIPYYERNEDGSFGALRYEGDLYPAAFEITDWETYDVEARCPDIAFIHNQYDETNFVTSVHPRFYSRVLREQVSLLVLSEYGLMPWLPKDAEKIPLPEPSEVKLSAAQWYADVLISFSLEHMRDVAIPILKSSACSQSVREHIEEKVVPLGSPKFDCVIQARREQYPLPQKWQQLIAGRKVLLYNTSLTEMLKCTANHVADIKSVIELVERQKDIVLWWRPHPLVQAALHNMCAEIADIYNEIVDAFKQNGKGIYDDTWDLHRAIVWSDGLLTNESSLLWLYLASGKPFSVQNPEKLLQNPTHDIAADFHAPLQVRMDNMRAGKGANLHPDEWNFCVWWDNFLTEDVLHNIHYDRFLERFIHYIVHPESYPEAEEYKRLQLRIYKDFVVNPDGTAGDNIYQYCKNRVFGDD